MYGYQGANFIINVHEKGMQYQANEKKSSFASA